MTPKNLWRQPGARCMQCGLPATTTQLDMRTDVVTRTMWCDTHAPTIWQIVARARRIAEDREWNDNRQN